MRECLRHGVTTHNWFAHYLWDIYGGFGHNGKIIQQHTLPSHTQPSCSKLTGSSQFLKLHTLRKRTMCRRQQEPCIAGARSGNPSRALSSARASFPLANPYASTARRSSGGGTSFSPSSSRSRRGNVSASGSLANLLSSLVSRGARRNFGRADEDQYEEYTVAAQSRRPQ